MNTKQSTIYFTASKEGAKKTINIQFENGDKTTAFVGKGENLVIKTKDFPHFKRDYVTFKGFSDALLNKDLILDLGKIEPQETSTIYLITRYNTNILNNESLIKAWEALKATAEEERATDATLAQLPMVECLEVLATKAQRIIDKQTKENAQNELLKGLERASTKGELTQDEAIALVMARYGNK